MLSLEQFKKELRTKTASGDKTADMHKVSKKIASSCSKTAKSLKKQATKLALNLTKNGHECVAFLEQHALRTGSPAARTLLAAIKEAAPKISDTVFKNPAESVSSVVSGGASAPLMAPEVKQVPASPSLETLGGPASVESVSSTDEGGMLHEGDDLQAWASNLNSEHLATLKKLHGALFGDAETEIKKTAGVSKWGHKYGMYGCDALAVRDSLRACAELRSHAGILATENLLDHQAHSQIETCYKQAFEGDGCEASNLLACSMPTADWKLK